MVAYIIAAVVAIVGLILIAIAKANDGTEAYGALLAAVIGVVLVIIGAIIAMVRYWWGA